MGILLEHVNYQYKDQWQNKKDYALKDINLSLEKGEYVAVIGRTGSGKSTLLQHLNGLLKPSSGTYLFEGEQVYQKDFPMKRLRQKVAFCFQYPEYQLFEETVLKDICFGPKNMGMDEESSVKKARKMMELVGLSQELEPVSPFALSGGQKRRVALAGILAMEPEYLILDEPAAGLDSPGRQNLFSLMERLNKEKGITIVLVSHDMDEVASYAKRILVMDKGSIVMDGAAREVFSRTEELKQIGLEIPKALQFYYDLKNGAESRTEGNKKGRVPLKSKEIPLTVEELASFILQNAEKKLKKNIFSDEKDERENMVLQKRENREEDK